MDVRKKLVELLNKANSACVGTDCFEGCKFCMESDCLYKLMADVMIANGVTVQEWIPSSEPPTRKDADKYCRVLVMEMGMMALVNYKGPINYPDRFPYWMPLPQPPKGK